MGTKDWEMLGEAADLTVCRVCRWQLQGGRDLCLHPDTDTPPRSHTVVISRLLISPSIWLQTTQYTHPHLKIVVMALLRSN